MSRTLQTPAIKLAVRVENLIAMGFDRTEAAGGRTIRPRCSQCEVLVIQNVACHEPGCRNEVHECHGCNAIVDRNVRYCAECSA